MNMLEKVLDFIIPRKCAGCGTPSEIFCGDCEYGAYSGRTACLFCGQRNLDGAVCPGCKKKTKTPLRSVFWAGRYDDQLKKAVWALKYGKRRELAKPLGAMLARRFFEALPEDSPLTNYLAVPIPLHFKKEYDRGFNQAELLSDEFGKLTGISVLKNLLQKTTETEEQVKVQDKKLRLINLENAFSVSGPLPPATIILIDDVATSGATLTHAAKTLKNAGGRKIIGLVVAHGG